MNWEELEKILDENAIDWEYSDTVYEDEDTKTLVLYITINKDDGDDVEDEEDA